MWLNPILHNNSIIRCHKIKEKKTNFSSTFNKILRPDSTGHLSKPTFHSPTSKFSWLPIFFVHQIFGCTVKHRNNQISALKCSLALFPSTDTLGERRRLSHWILLCIEDRNQYRYTRKAAKALLQLQIHCLRYHFIKNLRSCIPCMWSWRDQPILWRPR